MHRRNAQRPFALFTTCQRCFRPQAASPFRTCPPCRAAQAAYMRAHQAPPESGIWLAHCGSWHRVSVVPFTTPCCGTPYFTEEGRT